MTHAKSLRVIGQCLEVARLAEFELETDGENYIVESDFLTKTGEWILRHALRPDELSGESPSPSAIDRVVRLRQSMFRGLMRKRRDKGELMLLQIHRPIGNCVNFYAPSALTLTERQQTPSVFPGRLLQLLPFL